MRTRHQPLLAELHAHSTWSDGELPLAEVVDLYGRRGFDVLCITDHVIRSDDPWFAAEERRPSVPTERFDRYLEEIEREGERALAAYGLLVLPGLELTYNDRDPGKAAHAVAIGLRSHVSVDDGIEAAIVAASAAGAALVAAHPFDGETARTRERLTLRFAHDSDLRGLVHRHELFNRSQLFGWVASAGLPVVAAGDFHRPAHLAGWKTLLPCAKQEESVVAYLRSPRPVYLTSLANSPVRIAA
jgi:predicted metal-dependent phosphoesterase TrpH